MVKVGGPAVDGLGMKWSIHSVRIMHIGGETDETRRRPRIRRDAVHGVATSKELEIAGLKVEFVHALASPIEHMANSLIIFFLRNYFVNIYILCPTLKKFEIEKKG